MSTIWSGGRAEVEEGEILGNGAVVCPGVCEGEDGCCCSCEVVSALRRDQTID